MSSSINLGTIFSLKSCSFRGIRAFFSTENFVHSTSICEREKEKVSCKTLILIKICSGNEKFSGQGVRKNDDGRTFEMRQKKHVFCFLEGGVGGFKLRF